MKRLESHDHERLGIVGYFWTDSFPTCAWESGAFGKSRYHSLLTL
jgi:hypothetical protein